MSHQVAAPPERAPLTIYRARRVITMDESLPEATAVGVVGDRIVAVGDFESMTPWCEGRKVTVDDRLQDKVVMPGFIDNHVHPFLGALLLPSQIIAPEDWRMPDGVVARAAASPGEYRLRLQECVARHHPRADWLISWGYQPLVHGRLGRRELDAICPDTPLVLWQRSFHEVFVNSKALEKAELTKEAVGAHPQIDWEQGHFFENGSKLFVARIMPYMLRKDWYYRGLGMLVQLMRQGGITTAGDMLFGAIDPDYEIGAVRCEIEDKRMPLRIVNIADARGFSNRACGRQLGPPDQEIAFEQGLRAIEQVRARGTPRMVFAKAAKLFADGAMFSQLMQMKRPGYIDGHEGQWMMAPSVLAAGVRVFWDAGYQIHVHVNGDAGMEAVLAALEAAMYARPRFDHRFTSHHMGFHAADQTRRLAALGAVASVNPYYIHALSDTYAVLGLGAERAAQIVRAGSLAKAGIPVSFHSDFPMAPVEPLFLAWCAATRRTRGGNIAGPSEQLTLERALRGITIDAAFALGMDNEIGSIVAGKKADFTVLERDPFEAGAEGLRDVPIWGTVFEGLLHPLAAPVASVHASSQAAAAAQAQSRGALRYRAVGAGCCSAVPDHCDFVRVLASCAREALIAVGAKPWPA